MEMLMGPLIVTCCQALRGHGKIRCLGDWMPCIRMTGWEGVAELRCCAWAQGVSRPCCNQRHEAMCPGLVRNML